MNLIAFAENKIDGQKQGEYPVTIAWKSLGEKTYADEFSLLVDCLDRAPNLVWYTRVLAHAKPDTLKALQEMENKLTPKVNEHQKNLTIVAKAEQVPMFAMAGGGHYYE
jgi:hypothetical protein